MDEDKSLNVFSVVYHTPQKVNSIWYCKSEGYSVANLPGFNTTNSNPVLLAAKLNIFSTLDALDNGIGIACRTN